MLLSTITILAAIAIPAVMADNVGIQGSAKQNKPDHSLLRRDLANCKNNLDCDFPGTTDPLLPRTCALPLSNDPNYKSYDAVVRNGFGVCYSDGCGCYIGDFSHADLMITCTDLAAAVDNTLIVLDACLSTDNYYCDYRSSRPVTPGQSGDITFYEGGNCENGTYVGNEA